VTSIVETKPPISAAAPSAAIGRLMSLDALRGFDMFWIIGGGAMFQGLGKGLDGPLNAVLPQLEHVPWEGLHCWDLIWPLFMFLVGVAIPFSIAGRRAAGASDRSIYLHALRRAIILFSLGMVLQGRLLAWDLSKFRPCYSVLHGIAAGYLIATVCLGSLGAHEHWNNAQDKQYSRNLVRREGIELQRVEGAGFR